MNKTQEKLAKELRIAEVINRVREVQKEPKKKK
jgi:hypothetical protein